MNLSCINSIKELIEKKLELQRFKIQHKLQKLILHEQMEIVNCACNTKTIIEGTEPIKVLEAIQKTILKKEV